MIPIREGDRGPAVEDVQRRLLTLGYDLGPTGVDGVFLGATQAAVRSFQQGRRLAEDALVGDETWSALVDATFALGDRMLYLRSPLLHGHDVEVLQRALNTLGFSCGVADGIFGPYTERAVREFQTNCGLPADGIAGGDTMSAVSNLRHVWGDKDGVAPVEIALAPARAAAVLASASVRLHAADPTAADVAARVVNLARATEERADVALGDVASIAEVPLVLHLASAGNIDGRPGLPVAVVDSTDAAASVAHLVAAVSAACGELAVAVRIPEGDAADERVLQRTAVVVLDGLCTALA